MHTKPAAGPRGSGRRPPTCEFRFRPGVAPGADPRLGCGGTLTRARTPRQDTATFGQSNELTEQCDAAGADDEALLVQGGGVHSE